MIEDFRYTGINLIGWIQGFAINEKSILCVFKKISYKDNIKAAHWVGHSKLRYLYTDDFFKITLSVD